MGRLLEEEQVGGGADQGAEEDGEDDESDEGTLGAVTVGDDDGGELGFGGFLGFGGGLFGVDVFAGGGANGGSATGQGAFFHADGLEEEGRAFAEGVAGIVQRSVLEVFGALSAIGVFGVGGGGAREGGEMRELHAGGGLGVAGDNGVSDRGRDLNLLLGSRGASGGTLQRASALDERIGAGTHRRSRARGRRRQGRHRGDAGALRSSGGGSMMEVMSGAGRGRSGNSLLGRHR